MANILLLQKKYDIVLIKSYYYFASFLGLTPIYSFNHSKLLYPELHRYYVFLLFTLLFSFYIYSTYGMFLQFFEGETTKIVFGLELIMFFLMNFICTYGMYKSTYKKGKHWMNFLNGIIKFDAGLKVINIEGKDLRIEVTGQILFVLFLIMYVTFWCVQKGFFFFQYYLIEVIEYLYMYTIIVLASKFALSLKKRFKICNKIIIQNTKEDLSNVRISSKKFKLKLKGKMHYVHLFTKLSYLVELYNMLFGPLILIYLGRLLVGLIDSINYYLSYDSGIQEDRMLFSFYIFLNMLILVSV